MHLAKAFKRVTKLEIRQACVADTLCPQALQAPSLTQPLA